MPSLKRWEIQYCEVSGNGLSINGLCEFTHVRRLEVSFNNLTGDLPDCFSNLTSLETLDLSSNQLYGDISALESLTSLQFLTLSNNHFKIPSSLGPLFNLSQLKFFSADNNTFFAETEMPSLPPRFQLEYISLSCCGDGGSFPQFLYHQNDLQSVDLSNIYFKGEFPNWLLDNNTNLYRLVLANNSLFGKLQLPSLPHSDLSYLDISQNYFYGNIPIEIGAKLPSSQSLNMSRNHFRGSIPASIGDMNSLWDLDLSNNKLTGALPEHLAVGCSSLNVLILSNNGLEGQIFPSDFNLTVRDGEVKKRLRLMEAKQSIIASSASCGIKRDGCIWVDDSGLASF
ncbi:putative serine-threonine protein kinase, plant-type [Corchorus capsularis]|uniref:Putative serine-threonine protein kinase, plant-type n=1 Tax=Corchorus capsularis TaxID=210143 RepID=A0A1R3JUU3_COCAP|nr:putative serine-threonine protein kinase, plant-type [Corchorus capsularis]